MTASRSYRVSELLGRGSFGAVYRADAVGAGLERTVAIKVLRPEQARIPGLLARLRDEARMLALIRHRAIVRVDDLVELDGHWSIVMEYVEGCDVGAFVRDGPLPPRVALAIAEEVANALHAAATQEGPDGRPLRLVHRDVKPANIRVTAQGEVKLLDFGVARADFSTREAEGTNAVFGTPTYMAPERFGGQDSHAGDVYALGVTLFEMLAGEPPGVSPMEPERVPPGIRLAPAWRQIAETSVPLRDLVCAMMAPDPSDRPTARDCARALARIRGQLGGMILEDWAERVVPPALRAKRRAEDGRVGTVMVERPSQASLRIQGRPAERRSFGAWIAAAGGLVVVGGGLVLLVAAAAGAWWWTSRGEAGAAPVEDGEAVVSGDAEGDVLVEAAPAAGAAPVAAAAPAATGASAAEPATSEPRSTAATSDSTAAARTAAPSRADTPRTTTTAPSTPASTPAPSASARTSASAGTGTPGATTPATSAPARATSAATSTPAAATPATRTEARGPSTGIVALSGKAESVMLMGKSGVHTAGEVPVGDYAAEVTLPDGEPYTLRVVTVLPGRVTTIECDARYCRAVAD